MREIKICSVRRLRDRYQLNFKGDQALFGDREIEISSIFRKIKTSSISREIKIGSVWRAEIDIGSVMRQKDKA